MLGKTLQLLRKLRVESHYNCLTGLKFALCHWSTQKDPESCAQKPGAALLVAGSAQLNGAVPRSAKGFIDRPK